MVKIIAVADNWHIVGQETLDATAIEAYPRKFLPVILTCQLSQFLVLRHQPIGRIKQLGTLINI